MFDRYNRDISYLRISVTDRCNLRCIYCMPPRGVPLCTRDRILSYEELVRIVEEAVRLGIKKVRLTGGEPLVRKNIDHLILYLKNIKGVKEVALTTNGVLLSKMAVDLRQAGLDRINISLDTLDPEKYRTLTGSSNLDKVLEGIEATLKAGFKNTKLNMVLIPDINLGCVEKMEKFCREKGILLQRINHYSLHEHLDTQQNYEAERPLSCEQCNRIRLTADGKLKPCLFSDREYPVDLEDIASSLQEAIINKPEHGTRCTVRGNWEIGG